MRPNGAFSEYLITYADFVVHVPDTWSFEDAAQLGIAPLTALRTLYELLELPEPHWREAPASPTRRGDDDATHLRKLAGLRAAAAEEAALVGGEWEAVGSRCVRL